MPSLLPGYEYDIFISYRQKDNKGAQWVTEFVAALKTELEATFKEDISVYFDENPHDGLLETHQVDKSLEGKLKCLIFIPIISHTYCDPKSFAWSQELLPFCKGAKSDQIGLDIQLQNKNVTSRILPIQIHEIDEQDKQLFEKETGGQLRSIEFIFKSSGVNRPLTREDLRIDNANRTFYRDQINKTANAIEEIIKSLSSKKDTVPQFQINTDRKPGQSRMQWLWSELGRRNVVRATISYLVLALLIHQLIVLLTPTLEIEERIFNLEVWILTLGFPVAMTLAWFYEVSPQGFIRTNTTQSVINPYPSSRKKPLTGSLTVTILILLLLTQFIYFKYVRKESYLNAPIKSIAVLPFENRSENEADKYIAEGITDDIISNLSMISQLRVTDRKAVQEYQGDVLPISQIARNLDVMALLKGSIQRYGNKLVIRAQLIDAKSNDFIWGNTIQRTVNDIMVLQAEIAKIIADQLEVELSDIEKRRLNKQPTMSATAYDYYLRGRSLYFQYKPNANDSAIIEFKKAIEIDPNYAIAWAGLGDAYSQRIRFGGTDNWLDSSMHAGLMAIKLDSNLAEAYKAVANAFNYKEQYDKSFPYLLKAIEINPGYYQAVGNLGTTYLLNGNLAEALRWEKKAAGMSPKNWIPYQITGWIYRLLADLGNAESWLLKSLELDPTVYDTYELLGYTYVAQGRNQKALDLIPEIITIEDNPAKVYEVAGLVAHFAGEDSLAKKYFQLSIDSNKVYQSDRNTLSPVGLGQILLEEGNKIEGEIYLAHALENYKYEIENGSMSVDPPFYIAVIYAIRENKEQSLAWLQRAVDMNWVDYNKFEYGPHFEKYRYDPDFREIINGVRAKVDEMRKKAKQY